MSILNQSNTPQGKPALPPKNSNSQDINHQLPLAPLLRRSLSLKSYKSTPMKKTTLVSASESVHNLTQSLEKEEDSFYTIKCPITKMELGNPLKTMKNSTTLSFFSSLIKNEKLNLIKDFMEESELLYLDPKDTILVAVSSAVKLEEKQMAQITKKMKRITASKNVKLENTIDPSLIAGFVITYEKEGFHVIDLSVKGQLAELAAQIESTDRSSANYG